MTKLSIITVVFNAHELIGRTIHSVKAQTFLDYEYILVDGGSADGTLDVINENETVVSKLHSGPDHGIYDAMNKGLEMAEGEFVLFLNAGDELHGPDTLDQVFKACKGLEADVIYGEAEIVDENRNTLGTRSDLFPLKLPDKLDARSMQKGMVVCHQSFIARRSLVPKYDLRFRFSSDVDWTIKVLKSSKVVVNSGLTISKFLKGGISRKKLRASLLERFIILHNHFGAINNLINHVVIVFRSIVFILKRKKGY